MHLNNRENLKVLREQINAALEAVAKANGIKLVCGNCSFDPAGLATFKLEAFEILDDGTVQSREAINFTNYCEGFGFSPEDLNRTFQMRGTEYKLIGLKPGCRLAAIVLRDGKTYKADAAQVARILHPELTLPASVQLGA